MRCIENTGSGPAMGHGPGSRSRIVPSPVCHHMEVAAAPVAPALVCLEGGDISGGSLPAHFQLSFTSPGGEARAM